MSDNKKKQKGAPSEIPPTTLKEVLERLTRKSPHLRWYLFGVFSVTVLFASSFLYLFSTNIGQRWLTSLIESYISATISTIVTPSPGILNREDLAKTTSALISLELGPLRKDNGSIEPLVTSRSKQDDLWNTTQALYAIMCAPNKLLTNHKQEITRSLQFLENVKNKDGGGWKMNVGDTGSSFLISTAWAAMAFAKMSSNEKIWNFHERRWAMKLCEESIANLINYQNNNGSFQTFYRWNTPVSYTYTTVLALHSLLEARRTIKPPRTTRSRMDRAIQMSIQFLLSQQITNNQGCWFKTSNRSREENKPLGLTAQVLYTLELARRNGFKIDISDCEASFLETILFTEDNPWFENSFSIEDSFNVKTVWYPWTVLWILSKSDKPGFLEREKIKQVKRRLFGEDVVNDMVASFLRGKSSGETWKINETLIAFAAASQSKI